MSGSKTRFGFFSGGEDPQDSEEARSARTVFGRDVHLQGPTPLPPPQLAPAPTPLPPAPRAWTPVPPPRGLEPADEFEDTNPRRRPYHPRQSRLARFLGRWTESGRFESRSKMRLDAGDDIGLPRDTTGRNVLLVLLVAGLTFAITFAVVKLRQRVATPAAAPAVAAPAIALPPAAPATPVAAAPATVTPAPSATPPAPPATPQPAAKATEPTAVPSSAKGLGGPPPPATASQKPSHPARPAARPAAPPKNAPPSPAP